MNKLDPSDKNTPGEIEENNSLPSEQSAIELIKRVGFKKIHGILTHDGNIIGNS